MLVLQLHLLAVHLLTFIGLSAIHTLYPVDQFIKLREIKLGYTGGFKNCFYTIVVQLPCDYRYCSSLSG